MLQWMDRLAFGKLGVEDWLPFTWRVSVCLLRALRQRLGEPIGSDRGARAVVQLEKVHLFLEHSIDKLFI